MPLPRALPRHCARLRAVVDDVERAPVGAHVVADRAQRVGASDRIPGRVSAMLRRPEQELEVHQVIDDHPDLGRGAIPPRPRRAHYGDKPRGERAGGAHDHPPVGVVGCQPGGVPEAAEDLEPLVVAARVALLCLEPAQPPLSFGPERGVAGRRVGEPQRAGEEPARPRLGPGGGPLAARTGPRRVAPRRDGSGRRGEPLPRELNVVANDVFERRMRRGRAHDQHPGGEREHSDPVSSRRRAGCRCGEPPTA